MVKPNKDEVPRYEAGGFPEGFNDDLARMEASNQTLINDGVLLEMGGLKPTSAGARIDYSRARPQITDGPIAETKKLVAGFWLLEASSRETLVERLLQRPFPYGESIDPVRCFRTKTSRHSPLNIPTNSLYRKSNG
jgi:hypothetical protein